MTDPLLQRLVIIIGSPRPGTAAQMMDVVMDLVRLMAPMGEVERI